MLAGRGGKRAAGISQDEEGHVIPIDQEQIRLLEQRLRGIGVDRRTFLKIAGSAMAATGAGTLLAACGDDDDDEQPTTAAATATTAAPAATNTPGGGGGAATATTAPAATATTAAQPTATTAAQATATTATTAEEQHLNDDGTRAGDPSSHDFNADLYCQGVGQIWSGLTTYDQDFNLVPDWAETWESNEDASQWTFHIRPDNKGFSNGDPVNAETFVYSWQRMMKQETKNPYASILFDVKGAQEINVDNADPGTLGAKALDEWTLQVDMVGPRGLFPVITSFISCVPTHPPSAEAGGNFTDPAEAGGPVISNGVFTLTEWEHDQKCELTKNPNHWRAAEIKLDSVTWPIIPPQQGLLPFEAGDIDWSAVPAADVPRVRDDAELGPLMQKWVEPLIWKILPGTNTEPFSDVRLRRALSHSIDRDRINELTNGGGDPAYCLMPPGLFAYFGDDEEIRAIQAFDPEAAMAELVGTPFEGGQGWPNLTMLLRDEANLGSQIMAEDVAAQVKENIGLEISLQVMDFQAFRQEQFKNEYALVWIRWYYDYPDPNNGYFDMFYSNKDSGKRQAWSNAEFDELTIKGKEAKEPEDRLAIYRQCEIIMQTEVAYIPVVYRNAYDVYRPWVKGVPINRQGFTIPNGNIYVGMWNSVYIEGREG
jgi:ABC-type oligopeptide transport system substrate-binding subunit